MAALAPVELDHRAPEVLVPVGPQQGGPRGALLERHFRHLLHSKPKQLRSLHLLLYFTFQKNDVERDASLA